MKITHLVHSLDYGGQETMIIALSRSLVSRGHECQVISIANKGELASEAESIGIKVEVLCQDQGFSITALLKLFRILNTCRADILHLHNHRPLVYGGITSRFLRIPAIFTRHGSGQLKASRFLWNFVTELVSISKQAVVDLKRQNPHLLSREINVIPNGIDFRQFSGGPVALHASGRRVGIVARLAPEKDIGTLISAFRIIREALSDVELVIVGDGEERKKLEDLANGLKVQFLGMRNDIPELMQSFDVFVLSSLTEGISLTLLEAMAASKPIVATRVGGNPEVVVDGETGFLVLPQDPQAMAEKIILLLKNPELAKKMGAAGRQRVEKYFSIERMTDEYEKIYREVLA